MVGFFLYDVLTQFTLDAHLRGVLSLAARREEVKVHLQNNIEQRGCDGEWCRRAYFGDDTPPGSATNNECRVDSISQNRAILSGRCPTCTLCHRFGRQVPNALRTGADPAPGPAIRHIGIDPRLYQKGYLPGVRQNGGRYTLAAIRAAMAFAALGDNQRMPELMAMINPVNHA